MHCHIHSSCDHMYPVFGSLCQAGVERPASANPNSISRIFSRSSNSSNQINFDKKKRDEKTPSLPLSLLAMNHGEETQENDEG